MKTLKDLKDFNPYFNVTSIEFVYKDGDTIHANVAVIDNQWHSVRTLLPMIGDTIKVRVGKQYVERRLDQVNFIDAQISGDGGLITIKNGNVISYRKSIKNFEAYEVQLNENGKCTHYMKKNT
ncbi:TPA: hypothetical protein ACJEWJ_005966, partial [Klebsiella quasipneumoniae]